MNKWIKYRKKLINTDSIKTILISEDSLVNILYINETVDIFYYKFKEVMIDDFYDIERFLASTKHSFLELEEEEEDEKDRKTQSCN